MRSFADYRKAQLRNAIRQSCLEEGVEQQFEILRLELLEAIRLPNQPHNNILAEVQYNHTKKQDYAQNRYLVDQILQACKEDFYAELLAEAQGMVDVGTSLQELRDELIAKIKAFLNDLRSAIGVATKTTRDLGQGTGVSAGAESPAGGAAPVGTPSPRAGHPAQPSAVSTGSTGSTGPASLGSQIYADPSGVYDQGAGGSDDYPRWSAYRGEVRPQQSSGFKPAPYGTMVPSDGVRGGLSRLWRRITRPIRRIWHGDKAREMAKEHVVVLEGLFAENWDQVSAIIDNFEKDIVPYITRRIDQIVKSVLPAGSTQSAAASAGAGKMPVRSGEEKTVGGGTPADQAQSQIDAQGDAARDLSMSRGASEEEAEEEELAAEQFALEELASDGARKLDIALNIAKRPRAGDYAKIRRGDFIDAKTGKPFGLGWSGLYHEIVQRAYQKIFEHAGDKYLTSRGKLRQGSRPMRIKAVEQALGISISTKRGGFDRAILNLLAAVENYFSGRVATSPAEPSQPEGDLGKAAPGAAPVAPGPRTQPTGGRLPVGSKDSGPSKKLTPELVAQEVKKRDPLLFKVADENIPDVWSMIVKHTSDLEEAIQAIKHGVMANHPDKYKPAVTQKLEPEDTGVEEPGVEEPGVEQPAQFDALAHFHNELRPMLPTLANELGVSKEKLVGLVDPDTLLKGYLQEKGLDLAAMTDKDVEDFIYEKWLPAIIEKTRPGATGEAEAPAETSPEEKGGRQQTLEKLAGGELGSDTRQELARKELEKGKKKVEPVAPPVEPDAGDRLVKDLTKAERGKLLAGLTPEQLKPLEDFDDLTVGDVEAYKASLAKRAAGETEDVPFEDPGYGYRGYGDEEGEESDEPEAGEPEEADESEMESAYGSLMDQYPKLRKTAENLMTAIESREETDEYFDIGDLGYDSVNRLFFTAKQIADENGEKQAKDFMSRILQDLKDTASDDEPQPERPEDDDEDGDDWGELGADPDDIENNMRREAFAEKIDRLRKKLLV